MTSIYAPFTDDQVASLSAFQADERNHPFTCGKCKRINDGDGVLVATVDGWICPWCDYRQDWALDWMTDWSWYRWLKLRGFAE